MLHLCRFTTAPRPIGLQRIPATLLLSFSIISASLLLPGWAIAKQNGPYRPAAIKQAERVLAACRAKGLTAAECRTKAERRPHMLSRREKILILRCRRAGYPLPYCQRRVAEAVAKTRARRQEQTLVQCMRKGLTAEQCRTILAQRRARADASAARLVLRCRAAGLAEDECRKRLKLARRHLRQ